MRLQTVEALRDAMRILLVVVVRPEPTWSSPTGDTVDTIFSPQRTGPQCLRSWRLAITDITETAVNFCIIRSNFWLLSRVSVLVRSQMTRWASRYVACALPQVEAEFLAALRKDNAGKMAISKDPKAKSIVEGFRM